MCRLVIPRGILGGRFWEGVDCGFGWIYGYMWLFLDMGGFGYISVVFKSNLYLIYLRESRLKGEWVGFTRKRLLYHLGIVYVFVLVGLKR